MKDSFKVSVIMPTHNSAEFLKETISSVLNQTYQNFEILITDDKSEDNTLEILEDLAQNDDRIKIFKLNVNSGAAVARNNSIRNAKGRFIAFLDSDDIWNPDKLEKQISFMIDNKVALSYSNYHEIDESNKIINDIIIKDKLTYDDLLKQGYIACLTAMYDTDTVGKVYMPLIRKRQDWALWLKILREHQITAYGLSEKLAKYRIRKNSLSTKKLNLIKYHWYIYRNFENLSIFSSAYYLLNYIIRFFIKKTL